MKEQIYHGQLAEVQKEADEERELVEQLNKKDKAWENAQVLKVQVEEERIRKKAIELSEKIL